VELKASVDAKPVAALVWDKPGQQQWTFPVRPTSGAKHMTVTFTATPLRPPPTEDDRPLGIVVSQIKLRGAEAHVPEA
jgi:uncharacterized protein involved in outer membrane biogenesis